MANYWMKLYYEILDDPKMGRLSDRLYRRVMELFLLAGDYDRNGLLPSIPDIAWRLRLEEFDLIDDLIQIERQGIIYASGDTYIVTNFEKRQAASPVNERVQRYRDEKRKDQYNGNEMLHEHVTTRYTDIDTDIDKIRGEEIRGDTDANVTPAAPASFFTFHDAEKLYRDITGQITIPPRSANGDGSNDYLESLLAIAASYTDPGKLITDGKAQFSKWCNTRGKNGAYYKRTNPGWVAWWLSNLAPIPSAPTPVTIDAPPALCGVGAELKKNAEQEPDRYGPQLRDHINTCNFCGGKAITGIPMPDDVREKMKSLLNRKAAKNG